MPFAGGHVHDVTLRVHDDERRPRLDRVLLPCFQFRVVEHRVMDAVTAHRGLDRGGFALVQELRRVHADRHQHVRELGLQRAQLVQYVQAVDAAGGPEVQQHDLAAQLGQPDLLTTGVEPHVARQFGGAHAGLPSLSRHIFVQRAVSFRLFPMFTMWNL